ncbi:MAG: hypothetical protein ACLFQK_07195 [Fibrobacterota bacterium]
MREEINRENCSFIELGQPESDSCQLLAYSSGTRLEKGTVGFYYKNFKGYEDQIYCGGEAEGCSDDYAGVLLQMELDKVIKKAFIMISQFF